MIHELFRTELEACACEKSWNTTLERIARHFGFEYYLYGCIIKIQGGDDIPQIFTNYPPQWWKRYQERGYIGLDPVALHVACSYLPFAWDEPQYTTPESKQIMREASSFGLTHGITCPVHSFGTTGVLSFATSDHDYIDYKEHTADMQYIAIAMHSTVMTRFQKAGITLTAQQRQVLSLMNENLPIKKIAIEMSLSESGVKHHIGEIYEQLGLTPHNRNRAQALSMARTLGLIPTTSPL